MSNFENNLKKQGRKLLCIFILLIIIGLAAYAAFIELEGVSATDALYLTIISAIGGHGFHFTHKTTIVLTTIIMILEWICLWLLFETVIEVIAEGKLKEILTGGYVKKIVKKMKNHYILVGFGRVGSEVAKNLDAHKLPYVVIEKETTITRQLCEQGMCAIEGDVLNENTLKEAGIKEAKVLITTMGSDADNVFVTLSAKHLNPKIKIIARAERVEAIEKLKQAGATEVIMPSVIGGKAMAEATLRL